MRTYERRSFVELGLAAALALKAAPADAADNGIWRNRQPEMSYRRLGRTNYMISEVVFGSSFPIAPTGFEHIDLALDMGLNYIDTAAAYNNGASEETIGKRLKGQRDRVFLNTKVSPWIHNRNRLFADIFASLPEPEQKKLRAAALAEAEKRRALDADYFGDYFQGQKLNYDASCLSNVLESRFGDRIDRPKNYRDLVVQSVEDSLRRLGTDHVDLLMCPHGASSEMEVTRFPEIFDAFEALKKAGKALHLGVSSHSDPAGVLAGAVKAGVYSAAMVAYNVINHEYVDKAIEQAVGAGMGVIAMKVARPVNPGGRYGSPADPRRVARIHEAVPGPLSAPQKAYSWVLRNTHISAANSEMINAGMVKQNLAVASSKGMTSGRTAGTL